MVTCFRCNQPGHYANKCSLPPHQLKKNKRDTATSTLYSLSIIK